MYPALANDGLLKQVAQATHDILNANVGLHLYISNYNPTPASLLRDFIEASFGGYAPIALGGTAEGIFFAAVGIYQFNFLTARFISGDPNGQLVYGWWMDNTRDVLYARKFDVPINMVQGTVLPISLHVQVLDQSLVGH